MEPPASETDGGSADETADGSPLKGGDDGHSPGDDGHSPEDKGQPEPDRGDRTAEASGPSPEAPPGSVKVMVGTRRFHSSECPLISGMGESGIEVMTRAEAEEAGLTHCSVCQGG